MERKRKLHDAVRTIIGDARADSVEASQNDLNRDHERHDYVILSPEEKATLDKHRATGLPLWVDAP